MQKCGSIGGQSRKWSHNPDGVNATLYQKVLPEKKTSAAIELEATG